MASHTIERSYHGALPLGGDTFTSEGERSTAVVYNRGTGPLYIRLDGTSPSSTGANDGDLVVPANSVRTFTIPNATDVDVRVAGVLALAYSIELT